MTQNDTNDTNEIIKKYKYRFDIVFSYWIFIWYLLYICGANVSNPKLAIICGIFANAFALIRLIYIKESQLKIILFIIVNTFIKIIPFYTLINTKIKHEDIFITLGLYCIYLIWLFMNDITTLEKIKSIMNIHPFTEIILKELIINYNNNNNNNY
jgi:hypothetical protein